MLNEGSLYDQFSGHEAPAVEPREPLEREVNWQSSNNERFKRDLPDHVRDAMSTEQKDNSYYEFDNMVFGRNPKDSFGKSVNRTFGGLTKGFDFREEKKRYITLYRKLMHELG